MRDMLILFFSMVLVNNFVLTQFLGICPFLGVSKSMKTAMGMSISVILVMLIATALTWPVYNLILARFGITYLYNVLFILIIAAIVQIIETVLKKSIPSLYNALGIYLPLITTNCAILGVTVLNIDEGYTFAQSMVNSFGGGVGFMLALFLFSGVRSRVDKANVPQSLRGLPITLVAASITSVSFFAFKGLIENLFS